MTIQFVQTDNYDYAHINCSNLDDLKKFLKKYQMYTIDTGFLQTDPQVLKQYDLYNPNLVGKVELRKIRKQEPYYLVIVKVWALLKELSEL